MSSLRFTKAPPLPEGIDQDQWNSEWVGLQVGLASVFPLTIGYLGNMPARVFDTETMLWREGEAKDGMNIVTDMLTDPMWVSRESLIHSCQHSSPPRPTILAWLESEPQVGRRVFAVPDSVAEYLP